MPFLGTTFEILRIRPLVFIKLVQEVLGLKAKLIFCGPTLVQDKTLQLLSRKRFDLFLVRANEDLETIVAAEELNLLVLEIGPDWHADLEIIRRLLLQHPGLCVIVIDGNSSDEAILKAFHYGAMDFFAKPYNKELLVERIEALEQQNLRVKEERNPPSY